MLVARSCWGGPFDTLADKRIEDTQRDNCVVTHSPAAEQSFQFEYIQKVHPKCATSAYRIHIHIHSHSSFPWTNKCSVFSRSYNDKRGATYEI